MLGLLRNQRLSVKVSLLGIGSVVITALALVALAVWQSGQYSVLAQHEVDGLLDADLDHITLGVYNLVQTENGAVQQQVNYNLNVARHVLASAGGVSLSTESVAWTAINQFTGEVADTRLPKMLVGRQWLGQNTDPDVETPVVDEVAHLVGETATIFQRMNDEGDMLRVATTVRTTDTKRAIGTFVPAVNPDGVPNPVVAAILGGDTYLGRAYVVNAWYLTAYEPIEDSAGNLVGMLYVGVKQETAESRIRQAILQTQVGKTGYVYVLSGKGEDRGRYVISQGGARDGEDIWDSGDSDDRYAIQEIVNKAIALRPGELATVRYLWQNPGEPEPRWKVARLAYYAPWDWVIGASVYEDEIQNYRAILSQGLARMTSTMGLAGLVITILVGCVGILVAWSITRPVRQMTGVVERISRGELDQVVDIRSNDEIGTLARTFNLMSQQLKETVEGLRSSDKRMKAIIDGSPIPQYVIDKNHLVIHWNRSLEEYSGIKAEDIVGTNRQWQAFYSHERPCMADLLVDGAVDKIPEWYAGQYVPSRLVEEAFEAINFVPDMRGGTWLYFTAAPIHDADGAVIGAVETLTDITERKRAEEALQEALFDLQKLSFIVNTSPAIAFLWRASDDWPVEYVSDNIVQLGYVPNDFVSGRIPYGHIVHPADLERVVAEVERHTAEGRTEFTQEYRLLTRSGDVRWTEDRTWVRRDDDGRATHYQGIVLDITERKKAEEEKERLQDQLIQAQKMESVGRLAGGVAHDFNNMLSAILGHAELALMRCHPADPLHADLKAIQEAAQRSADLTRQLLAFARRQTVSPRALDLNDTLDGMLKMLQRLIGEDIDLVWMPGGDLWPVRIDPSQIDQLLANLCVNARDAIADVGKVTIETGNTAFDEAYCAAHPGHVCGEYVMLSVSDDGCGMTQQVVDHLFEPFFTTKEMGKGTGLGLATVYGIVTQNEGFITVHSEPNVGTTFKIYLPRFVGGDITEPAARIKAEMPKGHGETVLLVEDEAAILDMGKAMLEGLGYAVLAAGTPAQALRLIEADPRTIDLFVIDVVMPGMNGRELAERIAELRPRPRCLFMSGHTADVIAHHGVLDGDLIFLQKPFSLKNLASKVRQALERE